MKIYAPELYVQVWRATRWTSFVCLGARTQSVAGLFRFGEVWRTSKNGKYNVFEQVFKAVSAPLTDKGLISLIYQKRLPINKKKISPAIEKWAKDMNKWHKKKYK